MSAGGSCGRRESEMELTTIFCVTATLKKVTFHMSELTRGASYRVRPCVSRVCPGQVPASPRCLFTGNVRFSQTAATGGSPAPGLPGSGSLPDRGSVITRSAIWRGGTYLFGDPRNEHVSPPTYLSEGLASVPPIHARNDLRNDKNRDGDSRAAS